MYRLQERVWLNRMGVGCREAMRVLRIGCGVEQTYRKARQAEGLWDGDPAVLPDLEMLQAAVRKHSTARPAPQQTSSIAS